jgi:uncharacterized protein
MSSKWGVEMLKRVLAGLVVAILLSGAAVAGPFEDGNTAYQRVDYAQAVKWYRLAADQGHASAQFNLGIMYANGRGVSQDDTEVVKWYRLAADQGHADAQFALGLMYALGRGFPQDDVLAHMWFNLAATRGNAEAVEARDRTASDMTLEQLAEAQRLARDGNSSR